MFSTYYGGIGGNRIPIYQVGSNYTINGEYFQDSLNVLSTSVGTYDATSMDSSATLNVFPNMDISTTRVGAGGDVHYLAIYNKVTKSEIILV